MIETLIKDLSSRMDGAIGALNKEFQGLRTGRASVDLLASVTVDAYGAKMPLNQTANVNVVDTRMISVQVWDKGLVAAVEKGIRDAGLGLNPTVDGDTVRISLPDLTEERRQELIKVARKYAENAKISVRNVRRDGMENIKKSQKDSEISEDAQREYGETIQKLTDDFIAQVDSVLGAKEQDILKV